MFEGKSALREEYKRLRASLCSPEKDGLIASHALAHFSEAGDDFFVYLSVRTEVSTASLVAELLKSGKTLCVPRLFGDKLLSVPYAPELERGPFGILQPAAGEERTCAVAFTPLLAADEAGNRLGYGGGYYDRYFAAHPAVLRVGLAYEGQVCASLPHGEGDMPLDALVTERGVRLFPRERLTVGRERAIMAEKGGSSEELC